MKTKLHLSLFVGFIAVLAATASAETVNSTYVGPTGSVWSDPANWSPAIVPDNNGTQIFDVSVGDPEVNLDLDATVNTFTLSADYAALYSADHNFTSGATSVGMAFQSVLYFYAVNQNVLADLGNFVQFSGSTLHTGGLEADTSYSTIPGITSTIQFNGADIRTSNGLIGLYGLGTSVVDEHGRDALANYRRNLVEGILNIEQGRSFTSKGPFLNKGTMYAATSYDHIEGPELIRINGNYTTVGYPLDSGTVGANFLLAAGPLYNAKMLIKGQLTNYDASKQTLNKSYFTWEAANGASATTKVMGGGQPMDIVTSNASLVLFGPNTGFRDKYGNDALRNLATSARLQVGDRDFVTKGPFTTTSRFSVWGDTHCLVNGNLTLASGYFEFSPLTAYAREGEPDFPTDPKYLSSNVAIKGNFYVSFGSILRPHVVDTATTAKITVKGTAFFAGFLAATLEEDAHPSPTDSFTVLTAHRISGQFSNVSSGGRVMVYSNYDGLTGENAGDPIGSFLVTYDPTALVLSDFQSAGERLIRRPAKAQHGDESSARRLTRGAY